MHWCQASTKDWARGDRFWNSTYKKHKQPVHWSTLRTRLGVVGFAVVFTKNTDWRCYWHQPFSKDWAGGRFWGSTYNEHRWTVHWHQTFRKDWARGSWFSGFCVWVQVHVWKVRARVWFAVTIGHLNCNLFFFCWFTTFFWVFNLVLMSTINS